MDDTSAAAGAPSPTGPAGSDRPIFIVACPRSGTTLLQLMLHAHPRIAIPPENRFFLDVYRDRATFGDLRQPSARLAVADRILSWERFDDLKVAPEVIRERIVEGPPTLGSALGIVFREYALLYGKPRWGDKRPLYLHHLPALLRLFPDAQIIHIVRDGRDCVASLQSMPWWQTGKVAAVTAWLQSMDLARRAGARLPADQFYELSYERLVGNPRAELEAMCVFLGESFSEDMLDPHRQAVAAVPKDKVWHARTHGAIDSASINTWADRLAPWQTGALELLGGRALRRYGYALTGAAKPPVGDLVNVVAHLARRKVWAARERLRDRQVARTYGYPLAAQLTSGQRRLADERGELRWASGRYA